MSGFKVLPDGTLFVRLDVRKECRRRSELNGGVLVYLQKVDEGEGSF